jgi:acyl-CoA synthetase (AMP-forming)/AMP-acid ligase II
VPDAPYRSPELDVANVAAHLPRMARDRPDARAILAPRGGLGSVVQRAQGLAYDALSYRDLDAHAAAYASGLGEAGLARGDRVVLMVPPSLPFFALVFGMFEAGVVPVVLDPGMGVARLSRCIERAEPAGFIGIPRAHAARRALGWGAASIRTNVVVGGMLSGLLGGGRGARALSLSHLRALGERRGRQPLAPVGEDDVAAILFTSGSTGVPKGAVYTHGNFLAQVEAIRAMYGIVPGEIDLPTFPLFALFDPALGMTTVVPKMDFTKPGSVSGAQIIEPIRRFGITNMFGSPALLDRVAAQEGHRVLAGGPPLLPTLRRVITAGAPVSPRILEAFQRFLAPEARIHTPYGATESLPVATLDHRTILDETRARTEAGEGICVGRPVESATVVVLRITDGPRATFEEADRCAVGEVGEICVSGPQVTASYFRDDENTTLHKIRDAEGRLFHRVGDVGWLDTDGRLWFCGRKSQRVVIGERTYFTERIEGPFNALPTVQRAAFVGPTWNGRVVPSLCIEPGAFERPPTAAAHVPASMRTGDAAVIERFFVFERFPVDPRHNAKIHREELRASCEAALARGEGMTWAQLAAAQAKGIR